MSYKVLLPLLGICFIALAWMHRGYWLFAGWLGCNLFALGIAHATEHHGMFGKRPDGTLPLLAWAAFLPLMLLGLLIWKIGSVLGREPAFHIVNDALVVGRRLAEGEAFEPCEQYLDLTSEFSESRTLRTLAGYRCFPILDGAAPHPQALLAMVQSLGLRKTYVHCAAGHGRTGLVALALLLNRGDADSIEEGMALLRKVRPGIRLNKAQRDCIEAFSQIAG